MAHDPALEIYRAPGRGDIWVIEDDITRLAVDAMVSNDDVEGQMWAEVARAIKRAAGEGVELLAQAHKPYELGQAWKTPAGSLDGVKAIIHVASLTRNGATSVEAVQKSLLAAYELATTERFGSLGVGAMGSGPVAIPQLAWFRAFAEVSVGYLSDGKRWRGDATPLSIVLTLFEPQDFKSDVQTLRTAVSDAWQECGCPESGRPILGPEQRRGKLRGFATAIWRRQVADPVTPVDLSPNRR